MQGFRVTGRFKMGRSWSRFSLELADESTEDAREKVLSTLGSRHRISRSLIEIDEVEAVDADEIEDLAVRKKIEEA